jgi:glycerol-3-phosphate dehydrogenase subunit B
VRAHTSGRDTVYRAQRVVLATGGFASGGLELSADWVARETVLGLALRDAPAPGEERFKAEYFGEQPMARAGVAVDSRLRPPGVEAVLVVGAAVAGAEPWREGSGEGIALSSGHRAAELILAEAGTDTAAPTEATA